MPKLPLRRAPALPPLPAKRKKKTYPIDRIDVTGPRVRELAKSLFDKHLWEKRMLSEDVTLCAITVIGFDVRCPACKIMVKSGVPHLCSGKKK